MAHTPDVGNDPWGRALAAIRPQLAPALFAAYLAPTALESAEPRGEVVVRAADDFAAEKVVRTWGDALLGALRTELGETTTLRVNRFRVGDPGSLPGAHEAAAR